MSTSTEAPIALVTGGNRGLGRNIAMHLARNGSDVIPIDRSGKAEGQAAVAEMFL